LNRRVNGVRHAPNNIKPLWAGKVILLATASRDVREASEFALNYINAMNYRGSETPGNG
jgi:hypothetical protein